jgi:Kef-type K+ transport system membrane component KefB
LIDRRRSIYPWWRSRHQIEAFKLEALEYAEPALDVLLPLASFLFLLNIITWPFNQLLSCGLLGQILVGILWGSPLFGWLGTETQQTIVDLGYIGLILLVYEGCS